MKNSFKAGEREAELWNKKLTKMKEEEDKTALSLQSTDKFKQYLNRIINTIPDEVHNELWNHLIDIIREHGTFKIAKSQARNEAIQECQKLVKDHLGSENFTAGIIVSQIEKLKKS